MKIEYDIEPVTAMKSRAAQLLRAVGETRRPVVITQNGEPKGVLIDFETYRELKRALLLLKLVAQGEADARSGRTVSQSRVFAEVHTRLRRK